MARKTVALVGSTGSIGTQAVDVIRACDDFDVVALAAARSVDLLAAQAAELKPRVVALADDTRAADLRAALPAGVELRSGDGALASLADEADIVLNAVVGFAGLPVTLAALTAGKRLALANKESLVAGGPVVRRVRDAGELVPVDSEHSALHQCLQGTPRARVARLVLTASGGPFRGRSKTELADVTVEDALAHPTWQMGPKVTVDSSTLMNKGLEVIEAHELFDMPYDGIDVVVHPQSIVHSMVEFSDGATVAQLSSPDMRLPIGYALAWPDRLTAAFGSLEWAKVERLDFEPPDRDAFPCLELAYQAGRVGGTAPAWLNAANEVAVEAFLSGSVPWRSIPDVIRATLDGHDGGDARSVDDVIEADRAARERARMATAERQE